MFKKIDKNNIPKHIAIIMDGNGRWAKKRMLPRLAGHKAGVEALQKVTTAAREIGVKVVSYFAFSTENWKRSKEEVDGIFNLIEEYLKENFNRFLESKFKIQTMGDISKLPQNVRNMLKDLQAKTKNNTEFTVNIGLNYGSKDEILLACNNLLKSGKDYVTEQDFVSQLYTHNLPEPDLVIRTSGEQRLSNFMLFQIAYSELYFPKIHWPDFNKKQLIKAIKEYQKRDRRFGNIKQEKK